jgi:hypothetical protein
MPTRSVPSFGGASVAEEPHRVFPDREPSMLYVLLPDGRDRLARVEDDLATALGSVADPHRAVDIDLARPAHGKRPGSDVPDQLWLV